MKNISIAVIIALRFHFLFLTIIANRIANVIQLMGLIRNANILDKTKNMSGKIIIHKFTNSDF